MHDTVFDDAQERALARLDVIADEAQDYAKRAKAPNTLKGIATTGTISSAGAGGIARAAAATPRTVALYLTDPSKTHKVSTLN